MASLDSFYPGLSLSFGRVKKKEFTEGNAFGSFLHLLLLIVGLAQSYVEFGKVMTRNGYEFVEKSRLATESEFQEEVSVADMH